MNTFNIIKTCEGISFVYFKRKITDNLKYKKQKTHQETLHLASLMQTLTNYEETDLYRRAVSWCQ